MKSLLHVGCGGDALPQWLGEFSETRLDIDETHNPHIVADMRTLGNIGPFDAVFCSHALEHLFPHDVKTALQEFVRVLNPGGAVILFVPDLEGVQATEDVLFISPAGPICGLDLIYGYRPMLKDKPHMAHKTGFTAASLARELEGAGLKAVKVDRLSDHALFGCALK